MRSLVLAITLLIFNALALAQPMSRRKADIIPLEGQAKRIGWFVGPGVTWTHTRLKNEEEEVLRNDSLRYVTTYDPAGKLGLYLEGGITGYTGDPVIIDYLDFGVAYKNLRGAESTAGTLWRGDTAALPMEADGDFAERLVTVAFNANKFIQTGNYQFVQLSLGANADIRLGSEYSHSGDPVLNSHEFPPDLITQAHFKVGYGFKLTGRMIMIPALETPVFSVTPTDQGFGQLQWFSSNYRPIILSVRFLFLRARNGFDCPPPIKHNEFERGRKEYKPDSYHP
ncbi:MAG: hypothetical protein IPJ85_01865 [Flavobacteriales bacterium]|nr:hypothetical protein [Flavobacteriales bacterium]